MTALSLPGRVARAASVAAAAAASAALVSSARRRLLRWGATEADMAVVQPGDELIVDANVTATRAITIRRSPEVVWPWIAQLGQGRGGFYSYDKLENLLGLDIHSADRVIPEWQQLEVGDEVRLAPTVGLEAAIVEPGRALVLQGALPLAQAPPFDSTWAFILCEQPDGSTRLLSRERYGYKRWWAPLVVEPTQAASFVMSRKMLLGIRDRAERSPLVAPSDQADVAASRKQFDRALAPVPELTPVAMTIFGGVVDPSKRRFPLTRMPASDARAWDAIGAWGRELSVLFANELEAVSA